MCERVEDKMIKPEKKRVVEFRTLKMNFACLNLDKSKELKNQKS